MDTDEENTLIHNICAAESGNIGNLIDGAISTSKRKRSHVTTAWSTEEVMSLITIIEKNPCLWKYSAVDYKNRQKRENAWRDVAVKCFGHDADECKAKWANVKTAYSNIKRKKMLTKSSQGASGSKPQWPFWSAMQFYHNDAQEKTTSSVSSLDFVCESEDTLNNSSNGSTSTNLLKKTPEKLEHALSLLERENEDKWHTFGMYLALQMSEVKKKDKNLANKLHINIMRTTMDALAQFKEE